MERKVSTDKLKLGMYVSQLDRPWLDTPFLFQGFHTKIEEDLKDLKTHCQFIYIDDERGVKADSYLDEIDASVLNSKEYGLPARKIEYHNQVDMHEELSYAKKNQCELERRVNGIMDAAKLDGKINFLAVRPTITNMIESVLRNPDAYVWLRQLKSTDDYLYSHAIDVSVLAVVFGRHLGLDKQELHDLAVGTMFSDIGKMKLPMELLNKKSRLTNQEFELVKKHVDFSVDVMKKSNGISDRAIEIAFCHHERYNGKGYPQGLEGTQIPVFGRIAAIVDCYDAMTSVRPYCKPRSSHEAVIKLYEWRNIDFQEDFIEGFIQSLGAYPTGTVVELSTGTVGIVLSQNRIRRLRPKVMLILDENKKKYENFPTIDLFHEIEQMQKPLEITRALEKGAYGIDPKDYFI